MRSRSNTGSFAVVTDAPRAVRRSPARSGGSSTGGSRRRPRPAELIPHAVVPDLDSSPEALYRAEKARRTSTTNADDAVMAEAKRLYEEAIAETGKKRAGMRTPVVPTGEKKSGGADPVDPTVDSAEGADGIAPPSGSYASDPS